MALWDVKMTTATNGKFEYEIAAASSAEQALIQAAVQLGSEMGDDVAVVGWSVTQVHPQFHLFCG